MHQAIRDRKGEALFQGQLSPNDLCLPFHLHKDQRISNVSAEHSKSGDGRRFHENIKIEPAENSLESSLALFYRYSFLIREIIFP